jgi:WD40 repeat protein
MVVLGAPGAGKTTIATLFVVDYMDVAEPGEPVPILLSVAGWNPRERLQKWIVRQIREDYLGVLNDASIRHSVREGLIMPVLDGLDEMPQQLLGRALRRLDEATGPGGLRWNTATMLPTALFDEEDGPAHKIAFSNNGDVVALARSDGTVLLKDGLSGEHIAELRGHRDSILDIAFSADGHGLVTASADGTARLWDLAALRERVSIAGTFFTVSFSPDGQTLATGAYTGVAQLWGLGGHLLTSFRGHTRSITDVAFSHDGMRLATVSGDGTGRTWDVRTGDPLVVMRTPVHDVLSGLSPYQPRLLTRVAFDHDSRRLATVRDDGAIRIWNAATGALLREIVSPTAWLDFDSDGKVLDTVGPDGVRRGWSLASGMPSYRHPRPLARQLLSPSGDRLITVEARGKARLWDAGTASLKADLGDGVSRAMFAERAGVLITVDRRGSARVWDAERGGLRTTIADKVLGNERIVISPEGRFVSTIDHTATAATWDAVTGERVSIAENVQDIVFGHNDDQVAVLYSSGEVAVSSTGDRATSMLMTGTNVAGVVFLVDEIAADPNTYRLVTANSDGTVRIWDGRTGQPIVSFLAKSRPVSGVTFSPDGGTVIVEAQYAIQLLASASIEG